MLPRLSSIALALLVAACGGGTAATPDAGGAPDAGAADAAPTTPPDYARLFPADRVLDVDLAVAPADWDALLADPLNDALAVHATLTYDGIVVPDVALSTKGNSSRNSVAQMGSERYSFKVDTDDYVAGQDLLGVDKLNLHNSFKDPTLLRETIGYAMMRGEGVPASRTAFARLTINGQLHGLYVVVEQVDKDFLRDRFADDTGDLMKPEMPGGTLVWRGTSFANYPGVDVKTNETDTVHQAFVDLVDAINHGTHDQLAAVFDVDTFLRWLAVNTYLVNLDSYAGSAHNYYLYEDRSTGKWSFVPWDLNETFGNFRCQYTSAQLLALPYTQPICGATTDRPLIARVLADPTWKAQYEADLAALMAGSGAPAAVLADVDARAALVRDVVVADPTKFFTVAQFDAALHDDVTVNGPPGQTTVFGLSSFATRRAAALAAQLP